MRVYSARGGNLDITFRSDSAVEEIQHWGSDEMVARAARVSTRRDRVDGAKIEGLIGYLIREGHWSTLRHCGLTFRIEAPLFLLGQFVRHAFIDVNVQSGRYSQFVPEFYIVADRGVVNEGSSARPVFPDSNEHVGTARVLSKAACVGAWQRYQEMLDAGISTEVARNVLPQSTYTSWYASGNLQAWLHYLYLRNGSHGHPQAEHVALARQIEAILAERFPVTYRAWIKSQEPVPDEEA